MKKIFLFPILILFLFSCTKHNKKRDFVDYVNPFIGTGGHGHTFPGATLPFGMVQLSPDTKTDDWDHCSGYHYNDDIILGFSMTHLSGTGVGDYGDFRFVPQTGKLKLYQAEKKNNFNGYKSHFKKENEKASAGYYSVFLDDYGVNVELTATRRAGFQRYTFKNSDTVNILVDLQPGVVSSQILDAEVRIINDHEIAGYRHVKGWAKNRYIYFYSSFSKPFLSTAVVIDGKIYKNKKVAGGTDVKVILTYKTDKDEPVLIKTGISYTGIAGASNNLQREIYDWDFDQIKTNAHYAWYNQLSRIKVSGKSERDKTVFYTALYHSFLAPNIASDIDFKYRSHDGKIKRDDSFTMHTVFSLWDTFRALHPLFTIVQRKRTVDLINSMLDMYKADGLLPVWELAANETNCMIGYHAVSVIADAYIKGIHDFDARMALRAMDETASADHFGLRFYKTKGYIPADKAGESVSRTLEYAYDDWCIARFAQQLNDTVLYKKYIKRAQYYKNIFDKKSGFFRGKSNGTFISPFDPTQVNFTLTEANTWQYNFFVPQDINTLSEILGGDINFDKKLDSLFTVTGLTGRKQSDITGLIGQYAHGNEPSHHMAYLYNFVGKPWKTQKIVHRIMTELYDDTPGGLAGNEDCGQMSAWYVLSAMGFYPVTPGSVDYVLGTPRFDTVVINLENKRKFKIFAKNLSPGNFYVQNVKYNGKNYNKSYITHDMIMSGGTLTFEMGDKPAENFGELKNARPKSKIDDNLITPVPFFVAGGKTFDKTMDVAAGDLYGDALLYVDINNSGFKPYDKPITIDGNANFRAYCVWQGKKSFVEDARFIKISQDVKVVYKTFYDSQYTGGGDKALVNGLRGGKNFRTGNWQGFHGVNLEVMVDFGKNIKPGKIGIEFLQDTPSFIFMPLKVHFEVSEDGKKFTGAGTCINDVDEHVTEPVLKTFYSKKLNSAVRYVKIVAENRGICPEWHRGAGEKAWLFADEIWTE